MKWLCDYRLEDFRLHHLMRRKFAVDSNDYKHYQQMNPIPEEVGKILERLFVFVDSKDMELNVSLSLVVNPEILKILFTHLASEGLDLKVGVG